MSGSDNSMVDERREPSHQSEQPRSENTNDRSATRKIVAETLARTTCDFTVIEPMRQARLDHTDFGLVSGSTLSIFVESAACSASIRALDADYLTALSELSSRERMRLLEGNWSPDVENTLFSLDWIDHDRFGDAAEMVRAVVGVDPAVTSGPNADATGIVVAGEGADGRFT